MQLEDFLKGYEEQEASVWIDLGHEGNIVFHYSRKVNYSGGGITGPSRAGRSNTSFNIFWARRPFVLTRSVTVLRPSASISAATYRANQPNVHAYFKF